MDFDINSIFQLLGLTACISASVYLIYKNEKVIGSMFLFGFIFILQSNLYLLFIGLEPSQGECWATHASYYECQPFIEKLTFHISHVGFFLLALGVFMIGRKTNVQKYS